MTHDVGDLIITSPAQYVKLSSVTCWSGGQETNNKQESKINATDGRDNRLLSMAGDVSGAESTLTSHLELEQALEQPDEHEDAFLSLMDIEELERVLLPGKTVPNSEHQTQMEGESYFLEECMSRIKNRN